MHPAVGAPPQPAQAKAAARCCAVTLEFVGADAATPEYHRDGEAARAQYAAAARGAGAPQADQRQAHTFFVHPAQAKRTGHQGRRLALLLLNVLLRAKRACRQCRKVMPSTRKILVVD